MTRFPRKNMLAMTAALGVPLAARAAEAYTLRMNLAQAINTVQGQTAVRLAQRVNHRTNGQLKVELYPLMQLVNERGTIDALRNGVIDLAVISSAVLDPVIPQFQVLDMPFLFKDMNAAFRITDGAIGRELEGLAEQKGILLLGWGTAGFRELETTNRAVTVPDDMKGLRVRIQPGAVYVATYQALGAIPVVIDMSEAYIALQQRTVDAIEINLDGIAKEQFHNVIKHVAMLNHIVSLLPLYGSKTKIEALPAPLQKALKDEVKDAIAYWRAAIIKQLAEDVTILKGYGVAFTEIQYALFKNAMTPVYAQFQSKLGGDILDRVSRAANPA